MRQPKLSFIFVPYLFLKPSNGRQTLLFFHLYSLPHKLLYYDYYGLTAVSLLKTRAIYLRLSLRNIAKYKLEKKKNQLKRMI